MTFPYVTSAGPLSQVINHCRKTSFPQVLNADTLRKLGFAPKNESYVINTMRFLGFIDEESKKTKAAGTVFSQHEAKSFQEHFAAVVKTSYKELFDIHGDKAWELDINKLITFFRHSDQSSVVVGGRQANTFKALAAFSGYGELLETKEKSAVKKTSNTKAVVTSPTPAKAKKNIALQVVSAEKAPVDIHKATVTNRDIGLSVRIEINLPAQGDQDTYDKIFKSIKEHLING